MLDALSNKPWLALSMIAFLVWIGVRALAPRSIRYRQLYILPSVFLFISANQMFNTYATGILGFVVWACAIFLAGVISWRIAQKTPIEIDKAVGRIELPGTRMTLSLILIFIGARLYFGRQMYSLPNLRYDEGFIAQILAMTGFVTGYYLGRSTSFLIRYFRT